jgi:hypothetical protein
VTSWGHLERQRPAMEWGITRLSEGSNEVLKKSVLVSPRRRRLGFVECVRNALLVVKRLGVRRKSVLFDEGTWLQDRRRSERRCASCSTIDEFALVERAIVLIPRGSSE